jgi:hypothetical protein
MGWLRKLWRKIKAELTRLWKKIKPWLAIAVLVAGIALTLMGGAVWMAPWLSTLATALNANMLFGAAVSIGAAALIDSDTVVNAIGKVGDAAVAVGEAVGRTVGSATRGLADGLGITTPLMIIAGVAGAAWLFGLLGSDEKEAEAVAYYEDDYVDGETIDGEYELVDNGDYYGDEGYAVQ